MFSLCILPRVLPCLQGPPNATATPPFPSISHVPSLPRNEEDYIQPSPFLTFPNRECETIVKEQTVDVRANYSNSPSIVATALVCGLLLSSLAIRNWLTLRA